MIAVAHYRNEYLKPSETFIYTLIEYNKGYVHVLTDSVLLSACHFPTSKLHLLSQGYKRWSARWFAVLWENRVDQRHTAVSVWRQAGIQVLHAHFGPDGCRALAWSQAAGIPQVTSFYGYDLTVRNTLD